MPAGGPRSQAVAGAFRFRTPGCDICCAGIREHVAYRTVPEALPDVEDGTLDFVIVDGTFAVGPIKAGKNRCWR